MVALRSHIKSPVASGFTLIEMSIVLVIIGLIIGGVLVGRDLISAATIRAQISQIEKYNAAANSFRGKYGYLPGDIPDPVATQYGFGPRGTAPGQGDGNGVIESDNGGVSFGTYQSKGETAMFWSDLGMANLIEGSFTIAKSNQDQVATGGANLTATSTPNFDSFFPRAKITQDWLFVYSVNNFNYFDLMSSSGIQPNGPAYGAAALTVQQAYNIDNKIDDGLPQSGRVTAQATFWNTVVNWTSGSSPPNAGWGANPGTAASPTTLTCYDNGGSASNTMQYSISTNNGAGINCGLSIRFQ